MCEIGRRMWQRGFVYGNAGNLSARISETQILCTPSGVSKGHLKPDDLVVIENNGNALEGRPSSEIKMHVRIYARRPDCMAVVHAHPTVATGFSVAGESIPDNVLPEAMVVLGSVANVPFCMPGTDEVPNAIEPFLENHKTFLLANHGAVALGKDLMDAYQRMETLEGVAQIILHARTLGAMHAIPSEAFEQLKIWLNGRL